MSNQMYRPSGTLCLIYNIMEQRNIKIFFERKFSWFLARSYFFKLLLLVPCKAKNVYLEMKNIPRVIYFYMEFSLLYLFKTKLLSTRPIKSIRNSQTIGFGYRDLPVGNVQYCASIVILLEERDCSQNSKV